MQLCLANAAPGASTWRVLSRTCTHEHVRPRMSELDVVGCRMHCNVVGEGQPVVFIQGMGVRGAAHGMPIDRAIEVNAVLRAHFERDDAMGGG